MNSTFSGTGYFHLPDVSRLLPDVYTPSHQKAYYEKRKYFLPSKKILSFIIGYFEIIDNLTVYL